MTVDFRRPDMPDNYSDVSSVYNYNRRGSSYYADDDDGRSLVRSLSQPSLARSASEFTENWGVRLRSYEDGDDLSSPDRTPRSSFRESANGAAAAQNRRQYVSSSTTEFHHRSANASGGENSGGRRMFGGPTVSAVEWFHDSDGHDAAYK